MSLETSWKLFEVKLKVGYFQLNIDFPSSTV